MAFCLVPMMAAVTMPMMTVAVTAMAVVMTVVAVTMMVVMVSPAVVSVVVIARRSVVHRIAMVNRGRPHVINRRRVDVHTAGKVAVTKHDGTADTGIGAGDLGAEKTADKQGSADNPFHHFLHTGYSPQD